MRKIEIKLSNGNHYEDIVSVCPSELIYKQSVKSMISPKAKDIEGNEVSVGDTVYYARKRNYTANGELVKLEITNIKGDTVHMGQYKATKPSTQILKAK